MATIAFMAIGSALGASVIGSATIMGVSIGIGAMIGQTVGALVGGWIDSKLFGSSGQTQGSEGPRLTDLKVTGSTEGSPVPRLYGRARLAGQIIWATNLEEVVSTTDSGGGGGKGIGGGGGGGGGSTSQTTYTYFANFAIGICEGEISSIGRVWADGKELNLSEYTYRLYRGTETQMPDSLMEAKEGAGNVQAYRGLSYIVFERMALEKFGNRIPNINIEVFKAVDAFEKSVKAITILPGSGEFVYAQQEVQRNASSFDYVLENIHTRRGATDWSVSMDDMENSFENLENTALIVSWFGTDLRCGNCQIIPKVENYQKVTTPYSWSVAGYVRRTAQLVSTHDGFSAFGGTPSDQTVIEAIQDLNARGLKVTFYPFLMMDIPSGNTLPDPYSASGVGQAVYPWRGRITLSKAPGVASSPDKTSGAATEVNAFVTQFRKFILHYANLCATAGGVDAFYIGTELRGLTQIRSSSGATPTYPFVNALVTLAADVKAILPTTKITYGADWSEYFGHSTGEAAGEIFFHLDPLWASSNVSAIAIDCYWPLSDWRQGSAHLDRLAGTKSIYEMQYLKGNVQHGEGYDWFYASQSARDAQTRTPITDGAYGKPWVWRYKDIKNWWLNQHYNRPGGVQSGSPTAWVPQSKPFWFSEIGCPAINMGSNQPNVFYDPKSSESFFPYYSSGVRDDFMQRRFLQAFIEYWDHTHEDYVADANPVSSVYAARMVDTQRIYVYTWDARPYPAFPYSTDGWSDRSNWPYGHWLTGRVSGGALDSVVRSVLDDYGFTAYDVTGLSGQVDGYVIDRIMSVRDAIGPLEIAYFFDTFESEGIVKFRHRGYLGSQIIVTKDLMVDKAAGGASDGTNRLFEITRSQETDLPLAAKLTYYDGTTDYRQATVEARRLTVRSDRVSSTQLPIVGRQAQMQSIADILLQENWVAREKAKCTVPPSLLFLEATDVVTLNVHSRNYRFRILGIQDRGERDLDMMQLDASIYDHVRGADRTTTLPPAVVYVKPTTFYMDLPLLRDDHNGPSGYVGAYLTPWPGAVTVLRSAVDSGYTNNAVLTASMIFGKTLYPFYNGILALFDEINQLIVEVREGSVLSSVSELEVLGGKNACAVKNADGQWEVLQFQNAELIAPRQYKLTKLLRGQLGTEAQMRSPVAAGADWVLLNEAINQVSMGFSDINLSFYWKDGPYNRSIADSSYNSRQLAFKGVGLRPYSPIHFRLKKVGTSLVLTWVRRTRIGGDNWDAIGVPLGEDFERYNVEIYNTTLRRTVTVNEPTLTYTSAEYTADFGFMPTSMEVAIYQVSPYGRGTGRRQWVVVTSVVS